jgi:hypothetical protein
MWEKRKPNQDKVNLVAAQQRWVNMEQRIRRVNVTGQDKQQFGRQFSDNLRFKFR